MIDNPMTGSEIGMILQEGGHMHAGGHAVRIGPPLERTEAVGVELPESVVMRVKETDPVVSADSYYKHAWMEGPARLDIGLEVLVPQFISPGDLIRVNTTNGEYMERV